jgi:hypothetical protein
MEGCQITKEQFRGNKSACRKGCKYYLICLAANKKEDTKQ